LPRHWQLLRHFVRQDLAQRYAGQLTGLAWIALAPLLQLALFALVFGHIFQARVPGLDGGSYVAFLALGMWPWFAFSEAVTRAASAVTDHGGLLGKVAVPPEVLIAARVATPFLLHAIGFLLVLGAILVLGTPLHPSALPLVLAAWAVLLVLALGVGMIAAVVQVFVRDLAQLVAYLLTAWMFLSPVLYTREMTPEGMRGWMQVNPVAGIVEAARDPLLFGRFDGLALASAAAVALAVLALAALLFRRVRPHLHDFL
jgi:lipopolysaccharide transport system permease protein